MPDITHAPRAACSLGRATTKVDSPVVETEYARFASGAVWAPVVDGYSVGQDKAAYNLSGIKRAEKT